MLFKTLDFFIPDEKILELGFLGSYFLNDRFTRKLKPKVHSYPKLRFPRRDFSHVVHAVLLSAGLGPTKLDEAARLRALVTEQPAPPDSGKSRTPLSPGTA